ncbi:MAG: hypothetical protein WC356_03890 [Candidatus Micrarchaeia archaeon]
MRKLTLSILILILCSSMTYAFDAASSIGVGAMLQAGQPTSVAYSVGFSAPVVTKADAGYTLLQQTDYLYSPYSDNVKAVRIYAINQKNVFTRQTWTMYGAIGSGVYQFIDDENSQTYGTVMLRLGGTFSIFDLSGSVEAVQTPGSDLVVAMFGIGLKF